MPTSRSMHLPLQIYLDSSDFSNMAMASSPEITVIEEQLKKWCAEGLIEIRFSYLHIVEASPVRPEDIERASARFKKIQELCGPKSLTSITSVIEREISSPGDAGKEGYRDWLLRADENWLPEVDLDPDEISPAKIIREEIGKLPRAERRKQERRFLKPNGGLRSSAQTGVTNGLKEVIAEIEAKYPLAPGVASELAKCIVNPASRHKAPLLLRRSMSDIEYWPAWFQRRWDKVYPLTESLRKNGEKISEELFRYLDQATAMLQEGINSGFTEEQLLRFKKMAFESKASEMYANVVMRFADEMSVDVSEVDTRSAFLDRPGLATSICVQCEIARRTVLNQAQPRQPKVSDFGDVMHCTYLPFVDFYRADKFMAGVIKDAKLPFDTKVASNLLQLSKMLQEHLSGNS